MRTASGMMKKIDNGIGAILYNVKTNERCTFYSVAFTRVSRLNASFWKQGTGKTKVLQVRMMPIWKTMESVDRRRN